MAERQIEFYGKTYTYPEFIQHEVLKNWGTDSPVFADDLRKLCTERNIAFKPSTKKSELFQLLIDDGMTYADFETAFKIGLPSKTIQTEFDITHAEVKKLEKKGYLVVTGEAPFRAYGKAMTAPLYSISQCFSLTKDIVYGYLDKPLP